MRIIHNKLIRDNIPNIIERSGKTCSVRVLDKNEYGMELKKKLIEEAREVVDSKDKDELVKELADVVELMDAIKVLYDIDDEMLESVKYKKAKSNGKFEKRLFLEYVNDGEEL